MVLQRSLAASLLIIVLSQTISFGGGLLGVCAETASKICRCNHGSKKEVHSNKEDELFKTNQQSKKWKPKSATETLVNKNCHTADLNETHVCSCKKKKSSLARLSIYYQTWIAEFSFTSLFIHTLGQFSLPVSSALVSEEWCWKLIKPPRNT